MGYIDILVCGNSDPGTSGTLTLFNDIKGLYFNDENEPESTAYELMKDIEALCKKKGIAYVSMDFDSKEDYYSAIQDMQKFIDENVKIYYTSKEGHYDVVLEAEEEIDDSGSLSKEEKEAEERKKEEKEKKKKTKK